MDSLSALGVFMRAEESQSFVPQPAIQELRRLLRTRKQLVREKASHVQRVQKTLEEANIKIESVFSDVMGHSGRAIIQALIDGENALEVCIARAFCFRDAVERLSTIPGISQLSAQVIVSEIGTDMSRFATDAHLRSWASGSDNDGPSTFQFTVDGRPRRKARQNTSNSTRSLPSNTKKKLSDPSNRV